MISAHVQASDALIWTQRQTCIFPLYARVSSPIMSGFDANRVYSVSTPQRDIPQAADLPSEAEKALLDFIMQYRVGGDFIYRCVVKRLQESLLTLI